MLNIETHPFGNFIPPKAKCIVLGTFPTLGKNWRFNSFYPGRSNFFWRMLSDIYRHPFKHIAGEEAAKERLALCAKKGIAISDTIYSIQRKVATSSKDSDLIVVQKMDILNMLRKNPSIHSVILTGSSGPVSAHKVFFEHLTEAKIPFTLKESKPPILGSFVLNKREIKTYTLYSTSGINIGRYKEAVEQFRRVLPK
jgi:G:T/U-mismatch repair DNA glycosylase